MARGKKDDMKPEHRKSLRGRLRATEAVEECKWILIKTSPAKVRSDFKGKVPECHNHRRAGERPLC